MSNTTSNVLDQILTPFTECLTPDVAQRIVEMQASSETQSRLDELADKANEGQLSSMEESEYAKYREAFHFITVLQAKARHLICPK